jgi:hypothetical protein
MVTQQSDLYSVFIVWLLCGCQGISKNILGCSQKFQFLSVIIHGIRCQLNITKILAM